MDIVANMTAVLEIVMTLITGVVADATASGFGVGGTFFEFGVQVSNSNPTQCTRQTCPGSFYTAVTTAWANIGYLTHADVLRFLHTTHFGKWAVLLYIGAAITALLGVATNSPMRNYTWFFIGPALYSFLVGTTMEVQGVNWVVANKAASSEGMAEVWRNAEAGLANTRLALDGMVRINGKNGPTDQYEVAMPMVFLDELFSATSNILIEWTGIGNQVDNGGSNSNLSTPRRTLAGRQDTEAWWLLSNMKWGYLENITASTIRNPDLRDAFVTFLASECGDLFKQGIDSGSYIAATQARGATVVDTLMVDNAKHDYTTFTKGLHSVSIPTPRSLGRLFKEKVSTTSPGSFMNFSASLNKAVPTGRTHGIVCSEYLWTLIQGFRYEAGNSYYQMLRTAPNGFDEASFVATLLYGWDARRQRNEDISSDDQKAFLKHLILAYIIRNELIAAPQITTVDQRYAPAEQAKSYSEANIRAYGSKAKFIELYNAAVMMPYLQGILAYFLIVSYPIACMLVILPGHYKGFFTWVSFFAWIKLWDVGFAMVHVVERSVWAMIGNHSHLYATSEALISTAKKVGGIGANQPAAAAAGTQSMEAWNAIPVVCSLKPETVEGQCITGQPGEDQTFEQAFELFDKLLLTGANLDLDLSNGWYVYIMAALYTAVPAVTGQLVLGAKAGSASLVKDAFSGAASDGSQAAKTGAQHAAVNALQTNQRSLGQAATAKALRKGTGPDGKGMSLAMQGVEFGNQGMREGLAATQAGLQAGLEGARAGLAGRQVDNFGRAVAMGQKVPGLKHMFGADGGGSGGGAASKLGAASAYGVEAAKVGLGRMADEGFVRAAGRQQALGYQKEGLGAVSGGYKDLSGKMGAQAEFEAASAAWEAKNDFAAHASAMGGIAGMNAGNLAPNEKPTDATQMGMAGMLDRFSSGGSAALGKASASADAANSYSGGLLYGGTSYVAAGRQLAADGKGAEQSMLDKWNNMGGSYNPVTAASRVVTEGVNTANMGTSDAWDTGKRLTAFGADYAPDGKLDGDHGFRVQQVDEKGYMNSSDYSAGPSSRATSPWKFNGETNKTSTKHQD